jgi:hypothetical protein
LSASSGPWSTFRRSATLKAALGVILACTLGLIAFEISQNRTVKNPENKTQAEVQSGNLSDVNVSNMIIECDPACTANADFILTVTNLGDTGLSGKVPSGVAELGVLLPEPTGLSRWVLKSDGNLPIDSGTGVPGYTAGSVFPLFAQSANDPIDFSTFQAASASVGVKVTNYNAFAFGLGSFNSSGSSIRPISFTAFQGALGFPAGTIFFAFLADSNSGGRVVNRTPNAKLVVVAPRH